MALFLTQDEVAQLTGKVRYAAQARILGEMRIPFLLNAAARPIVARAAVERILGVVPDAAKSPEKARWKSAKMQ